MKYGQQSKTVDEVSYIDGCGFEKAVACLDRNQYERQQYLGASVNKKQVVVRYIDECRFEKTVACLNLD